MRDIAVGLSVALLAIGLVLALLSLGTSGQPDLPPQAQESEVGS
jgi:hypothetical protein